MIRGIQYEKAVELMNVVITVSRKFSMPPMSIVILDNGGHVKMAVSEDGVATLRYEIALAKANAALGMGMDSIEFSKLMAAGILTEAFSASLVGASHGRFNPNPGGVLIKHGSSILGAIGASGASAIDDHRLLETALQQVTLD